MKKEIQLLRSQGKTYDEIVQCLGCAKSTVAYHCSESVRQKFRVYRNNNRKKSIRELKVQAGGKCVVCGYNKCFTSLSFHHINPATKIATLGAMVYSHGKAAARKEAKKCILMCSNCHGEFHAGMLSLESFT